MALGNFSSLPNDVIFLILSKTSPLDLCRLSAVSSAFRSASLSDVVWNNFMPSKFPEIIFKSIDSSPPFPSKKDLFFHLCTQFRVLLDDGSKVLELDKSSGKICCKLGRGNNLSVTVKPRYNLSIHFIERWGAIYKSRPIYGESPDMPFLNSWSVICLDGQKPLRIHGRLLNPPKVLSPNTTYAAYLDYKITPVDVSFPLFVEVSVKICTKTGESISSQSRFCHDFITSTSAHEEGGWKELKIGEFHNDDNIGVVEMSLKEVKNWLCGSPIVLFVRAINIRPRGVHKICQSSKSTRPNPIRRFLNWIGKSFELVID